MTDASATARIRIRAVPGSRKPGLAGRHGDSWKLRVRSAPEKGRANQELIEALAELLGVPRSCVQLERGHTGRDKLFAIDGLAQDAVEARLSALALGESGPQRT